MFVSCPSSYVLLSHPFPCSAEAVSEETRLTQTSMVQNLGANQYCLLWQESELQRSFQHKTVISVTQNNSRVTTEQRLQSSFMKQHHAHLRRKSGGKEESCLLTFGTELSLEVLISSKHETAKLWDIPAGSSTGDKNFFEKNKQTCYVLAGRVLKQWQLPWNYNGKQN